MDVCKGCRHPKEDLEMGPMGTYCMDCIKEIPDNTKPGMKLVGLYPDFKWVTTAEFYQRRLGVALQLLREKDIEINWGRMGL